MAINPAVFHKHNVIDTCAIWNVLSSRTLYNASKRNGVSFVCSKFVEYESLYKARNNESIADHELCRRLKNAKDEDGNFGTYSLDIGDLQQFEVLKARKNLGKGELSSIVLAKKFRQPFMTDDRNARKLHDVESNGIIAQTTPHMLSWMIFNNHISDSEKTAIVDEHEEVSRPLSNHFENAYLEGLRCRLMDQQATR